VRLECIKAKPLTMIILIVLMNANVFTIPSSARNGAEERALGVWKESTVMEQQQIVKNVRLECIKI